MIQFPDSFLWGAATSAFQIEGSPESDGKGLSTWDAFAARPGKILDNSSPYPAADHYRRRREDVDLISYLGLGAYRFSISWPRVQPTGEGALNREGLDFYSRLVDELLEVGVTPFVTLFHWDLPVELEERGGWERRETSERFAEYAELMAIHLGDRVKRWITINEPGTVASFGYLQGVHAPGKRSFVAAAKAVHFMLLGHGLGLEAIKAVRPEAEVGLSNIVSPVVPLGPKDRRVAERLDKAVNRLFLDPVIRGHYPLGLELPMRLLIGEARPEDFKKIAVPVDFLGINHYARMVVRRSRLPLVGYTVESASYEGVRFTDMNWEIFPESFYDVLTWVWREYGPLPIYVTENGAAFSDEVRGKTVNDTERIDYLRRYVAALGRAIDEGVDVRGYFVWSLLDNFEWSEGLSKRFGLIYVDYRTGERRIKASGEWYRRLCTGDPSVLGELEEEEQSFE